MSSVVRWPGGQRNIYMGDDVLSLLPHCAASPDSSLASGNTHSGGSKRYMYRKHEENGQEEQGAKSAHQLYMPYSVVKHSEHIVKQGTTIKMQA